MEDETFLEICDFLQREGLVVSPGDPLGEGSYAFVFRASLNGNPCAVKISKMAIEDAESLQSELDRGPGIWPLTSRHAGLVRCDGYHVVPISRGGEQVRYLATIWELAEGSMDALVNRVDQIELIELLAPVVRAIEFLHIQGKFHRDVKPQNIMLFAFLGTAPSRGSIRINRHAKLGDLGTVRTVESPAGATTCVGTPNFGPPETFEHRELETARHHPSCDLYSLAVTYVVMLTGELPHGGHWRQSPSLAILIERKKDAGRIDRYLRNLGFDNKELELLTRAVAPNPADRPNTGIVQWFLELRQAVFFSKMGLSMSVLRRMVAKSIGVSHDATPARLEDSLSIVGIYRAKQLAYELVQTVENAHAAVRRMAVRLADREETDNDWIVIQHDYGEISANRELLKSRIKAECSDWAGYTEVSVPIYKKLDRLCADIRWIQQGYVPADMQPAEARRFQSQPTLQEFSQRTPYYKRAVQAALVGFSKLCGDCQQLYQELCVLLDD